MSDYRQPPVEPTPDEQRMERGCRRWAWGFGLVIGAVVLASVYGLVMAFWPAGPDEHAKDWVGPPPRDVRREARDERPRQRRLTPPPPTARPEPTPPAVPPPVEHAPPEVPMSAQREQAKEFKPQPTILQSFTVGDGEFTEPEVAILSSLDGKDTITLQLPGKEVTVPVTELSLVAPKALQTKLGACAGAQAVKQGNARTRNRVFLRSWRVACAAFTAFCARHCGRSGLSYVARTQYSQLRKRGGKLVASKASTRYAPWYPYFRKGDYLFFWKSGSRIGHCEICVGGGWTVGTSSSAGYVARRRVGNRGFSRMSVVRL